MGRDLFLVYSSLYCSELRPLASGSSNPEPSTLRAVLAGRELLAPDCFGSLYRVVSGNKEFTPRDIVCQRLLTVRFLTQKWM